MSSIKLEDRLKDVKVKELTLEDIQNDYRYTMANKIVDEMLIKGLITEKEAKEIKQLNKQTFTPIYVELID